jgi:cytochrome c553
MTISSQSHRALESKKGCHGNFTAFLSCINFGGRKGPSRAGVDPDQRRLGYLCEDENLSGINEQRAMRIFLGCLAALLVMTGSALAITPAEQRGKNFVRVNCSGCHAIDKVSPSPLNIAPPFRDLHRKYPIESLQESLAEGIYTGHPTMPTFRLDPDQINDVLSYLKSLE